jgi:SAM-dependent methyltransferase
MSTEEPGMRSVRDERGFNQGWSGGRSTQVRRERRCELLISKMAPEPGRKVLEIGCGRGEMARYLAARTRMQVLGIDLSERFVQEASAGPKDTNVRFEVVDFTRPEQIFDRRFDYVVGNGILHHLYFNLAASLEAMRRLLVKDGRIMFLEPNLHNPYVFMIFKQARLRRLARLEPDEMAFSRRFAIDQLHDAGFSDVHVEYRDFLIPGIPAWLIRPSVTFGRFAEVVPGVKHLAQSLFISART